MSTNEQARERMIEVTQEDGNNYCRILTLLGMEEEGDPVAAVERLVALETATLTAPAGGVSDAMVALDRALEAVNAPLITDKANDRAAWEAVSVLQSHGATLRAALSAPDPAAQGDAVAWQFRPKFGSLVADEWSWCSKAAHDEMAAHTDAYETRQLYTAPPAQPAERVPEGMVLVPSPPANCRQRLKRDGKPYPRSSCQACGKWSPKAMDCDALLAAAHIAASTAPSESDGGKGVDRG